MRRHSSNPSSPRNLRSPGDISGDLIKILFVVLAARAIMLLLGVGMMHIPYLDDLLVMLWSLFGEIARAISGSELLPRIG